MSQSEDPLPKAKIQGGKLPTHVLKGIVGGAHVQDQGHTGVDQAIGMTAGAALGFGGPAEAPGAEHHGKEAAKGDAVASGAVTHLLDVQAQAGMPVPVKFVNESGPGTKVTKVAWGETSSDIAAKNADKPADPLAKVAKDLRSQTFAGVSQLGLDTQKYKAGTLTYTSERGVETKVKSSAIDAANAKTEADKAAAQQDAKIKTDTEQHGAAWDEARDGQKQDAAKKAQQQVTLDQAYKDLRDNSRDVTTLTKTSAQTAQKVDEAAAHHAKTADALGKAQAAVDKLQPAHDDAGRDRAKSVTAKTTDDDTGRDRSKSVGAPPSQTALDAAKQRLETARADHDQAQHTLAKHTEEHGAAQRDLAKAKAGVDDAKAKVTKGNSESGRDRANTTVTKTAAKPHDVERPDQNRSRSNAMTPAPKEALVSDADRAKKTKADGKRMDAVGKELAKREGTYESTTTEEVLAGGVTQTVTKSGNVTHDVETIAQTTKTTAVESYSYAGGKGANASVAWGAEAGHTDKVTVQLGEKTSVTIANKDYVSASFENKAGFRMNLAEGITADASSTIKVHAEHTDSVSVEHGPVKATLTVGATGDAEAGLSAGAHLGFDGASVQAQAAAEAAVKAGAQGEIKLGDFVASQHVEAFAKAQASAKADMAVIFNPTDPNGAIKVKMGARAEASAGFGASGGGGLHSANGNGVDGEVGVNIGGIGGHYESDVEFKDGRVNVTIDVGGKLLVGLDVKIAVKVDPVQALKNVQEAYKNVQAIGDVPGASIKAIGGFFGGLFG